MEVITQPIANLQNFAPVNSINEKVKFHFLYYVAPVHWRIDQQSDQQLCNLVSAGVDYLISCLLLHVKTDCHIDPTINWHVCL